MKTLTEITNIIAKQIGEVAKTAATDYDVIVCPERIFMDDYLPEEERYLQTMGEMPSLDVDSPQELPYKNTIFVVIKMGSGQANMGVANYSCTLQVLSEADDFVAARQLLDSFIAEYNFEYIDGIVQSYFTPDMGGSQESVYTGFRALMSCRGNIRVPEEGVAFITDVLVSLDGRYFFELPFLNVMYNHACQPDPQAFAGTKGRTMALNRQSTQTITFDAYLWNKGVYDGTESDIKTTDWWLDLFSKNIIEAHSDMNKKFCLMVRTPFKDMSGLESDGLNKNGTNIVKIGATGVRYVTRKYKKISWMVDMNDSNTLYEGGVIGAKYGIITSNTFDITKVKAFNGDSFENSIVCVFDDWFILTNVTYNQSWGDISSWSLTFTSALEEEK
jgi:hypothetical protein